MTLPTIEQRLFDRRAVLTVGSLQFKSDTTRFSFDIACSTQSSPNKSEIKLYNLEEAHRKQIQQLDKVPISLDAGYASGVSRIFLGNMRSALDTRDGQGNIITTMGAGDGEDALASARAKKTFGKGSTAKQVLLGVSQELTKAIEGLGAGTQIQPGNILDALNMIPAELSGIWAKGTIATGCAARELTAVCAALGLSWSVQQGALQFAPMNKPVVGRAIYLSPQTGLVGVPSLDAKGGKVFMSCESLLQFAPPGRVIVLASKTLSGQYKIDETHYVGDTQNISKGWIVKIKASSF